MFAFGAMTVSNGLVSVTKERDGGNVVSLDKDDFCCFLEVRSLRAIINSDVLIYQNDVLIYFCDRADIINNGQDGGGGGTDNASIG